MATLPLQLTLLLLTFTTCALAQSCHYPDGSLTTVDAPCPNSDLCCPLNWQCLSNGLCYDPANDYYERRTCADSTWRSEECPDFCTYSSGGNEAILWCSGVQGGKWCCDGNRVSFDCCDGTLPADTDYFELPDGKVVGSITSLGPVSTSAARSSSSEAEETSTSFSSSTAEPTSSAGSSTTTATDSTTENSSTPTWSTTASDSQVSSAAIPTSQSDTNDSDHSTSFSLGAIVGLAIGVTVLLILCALMIFLLYRRHKKSKVQPYVPPPESPMEIKYSNALPPGTHAPEIDSSPKAATDGTSELYGSEPHSNARNSTVSSVTTGALGYSPTSVVSPVVTTKGGAGGGGGGRMGQIEEKEEPAPAELWGGHVYRPYRPAVDGQGQRPGQAGGGFGSAQAYEGT